MRISVQGIDLSREIVDFQTQYGHCRGLWRGKLPAVGEVRDIEIEMPEITDWAAVAIEPDDSPIKLDTIKGKILLQGRLESVGGDSQLVALRLSQSIVLLESTVPCPFVGKTVRMEVSQITIYDSNM